MARIYYKYDPNKDGDKEKQMFRALLGYCVGVLALGVLIFLIIFSIGWLKKFFQWSGAKIVVGILLIAVLVVLSIRYIIKNRKRSSQFSKHTYSSPRNDSKPMNDNSTQTPPILGNTKDLFCYKCGHRLRENSEYCSNCGAKIKE